MEETTLLPAGHEEEEVSRDDALRSLFEDEIYFDVTLKGSDGVLVPVNRSFLTARSPVFRKMLLGVFKEASMDAVEVGYRGNVLRSLVKFAFTDSAPLLDRDSYNENLKGSAAVDRVKDLLSLADAANYYALPKLRTEAEATAKTLIDKEKPWLLVAFLAACDDANLTISSLEKAALQMVFDYPELLLRKESAVHLLSQNVMEKILKGETVCASEYTLFQILQAWSAGDDEDDADKRESRKSATNELMRCIALERIDPKTLSTVVVNSGMATQDELYETFKKQAICLFEGNAVIYDQTRAPCWKSSKSPDYACVSTEWSTELLLCPAITTGVRKWSVKVEEICECWSAGVASPLHGYENETFFFSIVDSRNTITFVLDLTGSGTLHASVDGGAQQELYTDMISTVKASQGSDAIPGFIPAVSLMIPGKVRFLGFES